MKRDYDYYIDAARKKESESVILWKCVNGWIRAVLEEQRAAGNPLSDVPKVLRKIAGPVKKNEAVSLGNLRTAARQIAMRREFSVI